ncbi:hypothetical protein [Erysipelothrix sp. strain 2 (EsS2-6-Brazil)]|nr:hypothetical protein [Erysipelothrix sp. strain 2 (EsS2-6-Brazil)]
MKKIINKAVKKANRKPSMLLAAGLVITNIVLMAIVKEGTKNEEA